MLSPDETLLYVVNTQGAAVSALFFNKRTGKLTPGCTSGPNRRSLFGLFVSSWSGTDQPHRKWRRSLCCRVSRRGSRGSSSRSRARHVRARSRAVAVRGSTKLQGCLSIGTFPAAILLESNKRLSSLKIDVHENEGAGYALGVEMVACDRGLRMFLSEVAAQCPDRPISGSVVNDPLALSSQNGVLNGATDAGSLRGCRRLHALLLQLQRAGDQVFEAPTLRVSPGDQLDLIVVNRIQNDQGQTKPKTNAKTNARGQTKTKMTMPMPESPMHVRRRRRHDRSMPPTCTFTG